MLKLKNVKVSFRELKYPSVYPPIPSIRLFRLSAYSVYVYSSIVLEMHICCLYRRNRRIDGKHPDVSLPLGRFLLH